MKEFLQLMRRFVSPYKRYIGWAIVLNVLSAIFNVFSFTLLIPILNILFKTGENTQVYHFMEWGSGSLKEVAVNNFYYYVTQMIETHGPQMTLLFMGLFLAFMTMLKTSCYFGSSAIMIPLRTGVVRDIRVMVYSKVMHLPLGFFSEERKGDIIARMSGDVGEIENSITSSLDMLLKNPILILLYFSTLIVTSWQLTLFTVLVLPGMGWLMGKVGKSTMAKDLARELGYTYIDTGAMYRAVTLYSLQHGFFTSGGIDEQKLQDAMNDIDISFRFNPETGRPDTYLNGVKVEKEIRGMEVANRVSPIAALGFVRRAMVAKQQEMGKAKGIVMDGRDIGTVVFPDAELKIYVTASPEVRAQRRLDELKAKGEVASFEEVLENVKTRDHIDMTRVESPLRKADDALELDNSHLTIAEQKAWLLEQYEKVVTSD